MTTYPRQNAELAALLTVSRDEIAGRLEHLEWLADPSADPSLLTRDPALVRRRIQVFLQGLIDGLETGDWSRFHNDIAEPTITLLRSGARSAQQLNERAHDVAAAIVPSVAASGSGDALMSLFDTLQAISGGIVATHHERLLEQLGRVNELKSLFMRLTSHEIRGPLTVMQGYATMIAEGTIGDREEAIAAAGHIVLAGDTAVSLIDDLSDMASLVEGENELALERVVLSNVITRALSAVATEAQARGVEISVEIRDGELQADAGRMVVAVRNLLSNAIKYGPANDVVRLRAAVRRNGWVTVEVSDHGPGVPRTERSAIFDSYYRSEATRGSDVPGSGLGLYVVRRIAELHGGTVRVRSDHGTGSRFVFSLPANAAPPGSSGAT